MKCRQSFSWFNYLGPNELDMKYVLRSFTHLPCLAAISTEGAVLIIRAEIAKFFM
jgi:hypothetical protein